MSGGISGGGGGGTTVQRTEPWQEQKPYLIRGFQEAQSRVLDQTPEYFPGQTVVPFSPETEAAIGITTQRALQGSPLDTAAYQNIMGTLSGDYLQGGDAFQQSLDAAVRDTERRVLPRIDSAFNRSGRFGSGLAQEAVASAIADTVGSRYADNYAAERENQLRASVLAPQIADRPFSDASRLAEVGAARENLSGQQLADQVSRYNFARDIGRQQLADYMSLIQGGYGGTSTQTQNVPRNPVLSGAGGALLGYGLQSALPASLSGLSPFLPGIGLLGGLFN